MSSLYLNYFSCLRIYCEEKQWPKKRFKLFVKQNFFVKKKTHLANIGQ